MLKPQKSLAQLSFLPQRMQRGIAATELANYELREWARMESVLTKKYYSGSFVLFVVKKTCIRNKKMKDSITENTEISNQINETVLREK